MAGPTDAIKAAKIITRSRAGRRVKTTAKPAAAAVNQGGKASPAPVVAAPVATPEAPAWGHYPLPPPPLEAKPIGLSFEQHLKNNKRYDDYQKRVSQHNAAMAEQTKGMKAAPRAQAPKPKTKKAKANPPLKEAANSPYPAPPSPIAVTFDQTALAASSRVIPSTTRGAVPPRAGANTPKTRSAGRTRPASQMRRNAAMPRSPTISTGPMVTRAGGQASTPPAAAQGSRRATSGPITKYHVAGLAAGAGMVSVGMDNRGQPDKPKRGPSVSSAFMRGQAAPSRRPAGPAMASESTSTQIEKRPSSEGRRPRVTIDDSPMRAGPKPAAAPRQGRTMKGKELADFIGLDAGSAVRTYMETGKHKYPVKGKK